MRASKYRIMRLADWSGFPRMSPRGPGSRELRWIPDTTGEHSPESEGAAHERADRSRRQPGRLGEQAHQDVCGDRWGAGARVPGRGADPVADGDRPQDRHAAPDRADLRPGRRELRG